MYGCEVAVEFNLPDSVREIQTTPQMGTGPILDKILPYLYEPEKSLIESIIRLERWELMDVLYERDIMHRSYRVRMVFSLPPALQRATASIPDTRDSQVSRPGTTRRMILGRKP